ncbi:hypothetical protein L207DRAFT_588120 [Hyaloscypha variabilis F]|uniref:Uncharacterized protein n=1 Tax=Hyaloscypha variabilis (strain UAMH 11265 / GT02V1 / F) TaxID=1149755 RepID=A0A2J6R7V3_HYAVF|nr:hypothetical protein L207DRAFT_588120 [Hyaloscypha variabilis F]
MSCSLPGVHPTKCFLSFAVATQMAACKTLSRQCGNWGTARLELSSTESRSSLPKYEYQYALRLLTHLHIMTLYCSVRAARFPSSSPPSFRHWALGIGHRASDMEQWAAKLFASSPPLACYIKAANSLSLHLFQHWDPNSRVLQP